MKWTPLLFSSEMARAMVENRKWQTRRLNGLKEINEHPDDWHLQDLSVDPLIEYPGGKTRVLKGLIATFEHVEFGEVYRNVRCPFGKVGDWVWGRETWRELIDLIPGDRSSSNYVDYRADHLDDSLPDLNSNVKWRPSIFMPRWASRIERELVGIRLERVQGITVKDVVAEGVSDRVLMPADVDTDSDYFHVFAQQQILEKFIFLWDFINEPRGCGMEHNPWCWVLEFPH